MSSSFNRWAVTPVWLVVVWGLFLLTGLPLTAANAGFVLFVAIAPPAILLVMLQGPALTLAQAIAEEQRPGTRSGTK